MNYFKEPCILKEGHRGTDRYTIEDEMFKRREIVCVDEIDSDQVNSLIAQILYLAHEDAQKEITVYINSPGGEVSSGLALYDVMKAVSCPIHTVCVGMAASMAAVLFAAGDRREMLPHARLMIHNPLLQGLSGSALQVQSLSNDLMRTREILCELLARHTGKTIDEIYEKTRTDSYFYADEAVDFGLADAVIDKI